VEGPVNAGHPRNQEAKTVFALLVTSDSRTKDDDETGRLAVRLIEDAGHRVKLYDMAPNDGEKIEAWLRKAVGSPEVRVILTSGGTGVGAKDKTVDVARPMFEKELPGFGELFRRLSFDEVGLPGVWSRAVAGVVRGKLVFCLPGSRGAMETALKRIILPGLGHMLWELDRR
jgi:molybdenum cofactor biosynthesis protein B